jgi:uncharacterized membrane-anchored protein
MQFSLCPAKEVAMARRSDSPFSASKVPEVTLAFWITKILTTGMGETASDFFAKTFEPVFVVAVAGLALIGALALQLTRRRYVPWVYWLAVAMVSVFGTMAADVVHVVFRVPYVMSTAAFSIALVAVFGAWYWFEGSLSIHSIVTRRREVFYWATVLATFAVGTAAGDMSAVTLHLGYFASGIVFAALIAIPAVAWKLGAVNEVVGFWFAYVVTRPLGASFADWAGVPAARGGLGLGTGEVTLALTILIVALVAYLSVGAAKVETPVVDQQEMTEL